MYEKQRIPPIAHRVIRCAGMCTAIIATCVLVGRWKSTTPVPLVVMRVAGLMESEGRRRIAERPELWMRRCTSSKGTRFIACELINTTDQPIYFSGHGPQYPFTTAEQWTPAGYSPLYQGWCGTGAATFELPARQTVLFCLREAPPDDRMLRVSLHYASSPSGGESHILYGRFGFP